ncbi:hypothetical protein ACH5RR_038396 [Cinchona calisaya]|uniref:Uncharacterized protein n=1 Tax=Cinchona calisaya TaxID=153742 RepID=A0ABD2XVS0_9GENT
MQSIQLHSLSPLFPVNTHIKTPKTEPKNTTATTKHHNFMPSREDIFSNELTSLRTSIDERNPKLGSCIHARTLKLGLENDAFVANSLINMYTKCGQIEDADNLFDEMPHRTIVSWTSMISGYCQVGLEDDALFLFLQMLEILQPNEFTLAVVLQACGQKGEMNLVKILHSYVIKCGFMGDGFMQNSLIDAYAKSGLVDAAEKLLDRCCWRDVVSWTSVISGCAWNGMVDRAVGLFFRMQKDGVLPNEVTVLSILRACSEVNNSWIFRWVHGLILKTGMCRNAAVVNSLIEMYCMNGYCNEGLRVFCDFCFTSEGLYLNPETMAILLQGCGCLGSLKLGEEFHGYLIKHGFFPCTVIENSLIYMYGENADDDAAFQVFTKMSGKDIISSNTMLRCFVKNEQPSKALTLLGDIHRNSVKDHIFPDFVTMLTSLQACSVLASLLCGQVIQSYITKTGLLHDTFIQNALIDMYGKSGQLELAERIFREMSNRDLSSWNSIIAAYGINGSGISALQMFAEIKRSENYNPNSITFTNVLSACAHAGLVEEGFDIFSCMDREYGVEPIEEHFACMVDLLGRSGRIEEAEAFLEKIPRRFGPDVWGTLLSASLLSANVKTAEKAASVLAILEPNSTVWRIALSNVYADAGRWSEVAKVRAEIRGSEGLRKEGGWSILNLRERIFRFMVGDTNHPESGLIYEVIDGLHRHMREFASSY